MNRLFSAVALVLLTMACGKEEKVLPVPRESGDGATSYFCQMALADHEGPRAQAFTFDAIAPPLWFVSVGEALLYARLEAVKALYVNDMARATWRQPEPGTWILAEGAVYVVGSRRGSGMGGVQEVVPFSDPTAAEAFARTYGGQVMRLEDIREEDLFPVTAEEGS